MSQPSDRNLLVGILALQMDFISRDQLLAAINAWVLHKDRPLEQILLDNKALSADTMTLLQALVAKHLELHGNDAQRSLQSLSSIGRLRDDLQSLADPDIHATVSHMPHGIGTEATLDHAASQIDALCDDFVRAWRRGERPRIEDYLQRTPEATRLEVLESLLREEIHLRRAAGEAVARPDYLVRFPDASVALTRAFESPQGTRASRSAGSGPGATRAKTDSVHRFRVIRPHAKGGLGEVFVARDTELNREVALKEIQSRYAEHPDSRSRFLLEAEVTGSLEHPGIVPVYGLGQYADGRPFYAMRFIKGDSLKDAIEHFHAKYGDAKDFTTGEVGVEFRKLLGRFIDVCEAIEYAHSRGVLHRDLKPGNIMLGKYGETLVVDWGLAKVIGRAEHHRSSGEATLAPESGSGSAPTQMGSAVGTPAFMSPEQAAGKLDELGPAADVYSLGATLFVLLTGQHPYADQEQRDLQHLLALIRTGPCRSPREIKPCVPITLDAICRKAMATAPQSRYEECAHLAKDIENWLAFMPPVYAKEPIPARLHRHLRSTIDMLIAVTVCVLSIGVYGRFQLDLLLNEYLDSFYGSSTAVFLMSIALVAFPAALSIVLWVRFASTAWQCRFLGVMAGGILAALFCRALLSCGICIISGMEHSMLPDGADVMRNALVAGIAGVVAAMAGRILKALGMWPNATFAAALGVSAALVGVAKLLLDATSFVCGY